MHHTRRTTRITLAVINPVNAPSIDRRESGGFTLATDQLGDLAILTVNLEVFEKAAVFKTAYWATGKAFLYILPTTDGKPLHSLQIEVRPKVIGKETAEQLAREIANALIDHQTRQIVLHETAAARDALLSRAFGEGHKHLNPESLA
jgi:His-Xaa-Ser system protein HxsD